MCSVVIKVLVGQRRVGKSYILYQFMHDIKEMFHDSFVLYVNKGLKEFTNIKTGDDLYNYIKPLLDLTKGRMRNFVFIDEIQDIIGFETALQSLFAEHGREFGNLLKIHDNFPKYVVSLDEVLPNTHFKGIRHMHLREFLTQENR